MMTAKEWVRLLAYTYWDFDEVSPPRDAGRLFYLRSEVATSTVSNWLDLKKVMAPIHLRAFSNDQFALVPSAFWPYLYPFFIHFHRSPYLNITRALTDPCYELTKPSEHDQAIALMTLNELLQELP